MAANDKLHQFGGYQQACELFDLVVAEMTTLSDDPPCWRLVSPQIASADSIASNIAEGYGRETRVEYTRFLVISRGSATETRGRYEKRLKHWLPAETITGRVALCEEIIAILGASIRRLRSE